MCGWLGNLLGRGWRVARPFLFTIRSSPKHWRREMVQRLNWLISVLVVDGWGSSRKTSHHLIHSGCFVPRWTVSYPLRSSFRPSLLWLSSIILLSQRTTKLLFFRLLECLSKRTKLDRRGNGGRVSVSFDVALLLGREYYSLAHAII